MGHEAEFKSVRKERVTALQKLKPSSVFETYVGEEKMVTQFKGLDSAGEDAKIFVDAHGDAAKYFKVWINKIRDQLKKEKGDQKALGKIVDGLEDDVQKLLQEIEHKAKRLQATSEGPEGGKAVVDKMVEGVRAKKLKAALAHFQERREMHLDAVEKLEKEVKSAGPQLRKWHETAAAAVGQALGLAKLGRLNDARKVADLALKCAEEAEKTAQTLKSAYEQRITKTFQIDRNRGFLTYCDGGEFDLQEDQKPEFLKGQIGITAIFNKAQHLGKQVLGMIGEYEQLAEDTRVAATESDEAAKMKDIRGMVLKGLQQALQKGKQIAASINEQYENETKSGLTSSTKQYIAQWETPSLRPGLRESMPPKITAWKAKINALEQEVNVLESLTKSQIAKLPKDLSSQTEFKSLSTELLQLTIGTKRQVSSFAKSGEGYIGQMETLLNS